jgi:hypothetical protein
MDNSEYFRLGYPGSDYPTQIALWEPVLDRFLLVLCDHPTVIKNIQMIASSRYLLIECDLSSADNYSPNLIDNSCCEQWTLGNKKDIKTSKHTLHTKPITVEHLISSHAEITWDVCTEKSWLQTVWYFLKFLQELKNLQHNWYYYNQFIKKINYTNESQSQDYFDCVDLTETYIFENLYLRRDQDSVCKDIENFIQQINPTIRNRWQQWTQMYHD